MTAYLPDEPAHAEMRALLLAGEQTVLTSELSDVEFARAMAAAGRGGRVPQPATIIERFRLETAPGRLIGLIDLRPRAILARAAELVRVVTLGSLEAIQLAVLLEDVLPVAGEQRVELVSRDWRQVAAARALGLAVHG